MGVSTPTLKFIETQNITTTHHAVTGARLTMATLDQKSELTQYKPNARSITGNMAKKCTASMESDIHI